MQHSGSSGLNSPRPRDNYVDKRDSDLVLSDILSPGADKGSFSVDIENFINA